MTGWFGPFPARLPHAGAVAGDLLERIRKPTQGPSMPGKSGRSSSRSSVHSASGSPDEPDASTHGGPGLPRGPVTRSGRRRFAEPMMHAAPKHPRVAPAGPGGEACILDTGERPRRPGLGPVPSERRPAAPEVLRARRVGHGESASIQEPGVLDEVWPFARQSPDRLQGGRRAPKSACCRSRPLARPWRPSARRGASPA